MCISIQDLGPISIRRFSYLPLTGRSYKDVPAVEADEISEALKLIANLRLHLLAPDCGTLASYCSILSQVRSDILLAHPSLDLPEPTLATLENIIRGDFPTICLGNLISDMYPGDQMWAFVLPEDPGKIHIWADVLKYVQRPVSSARAKYTHLEPIHFQHLLLTIISHQLCHVFAQKVFGAWTTPRGVGGGGESGWGFAERVLGGQLMVEWPEDHAWDLRRATRLLFHVKNRGLYDISSTHLRTRQTSLAVRNSIEELSLRRLEPDTMATWRVPLHKPGFVRAPAGDGAVETVPDDSLDPAVFGEDFVEVEPDPEPCQDVVRVSIGGRCRGR